MLLNPDWLCVTTVVQGFVFSRSMLLGRERSNSKPIVQVSLIICKSLFGQSLFGQVIKLSPANLIHVFLARPTKKKYDSGKTWTLNLLVHGALCHRTTISCYNFDWYLSFHICSSLTFCRKKLFLLLATISKQVTSKSRPDIFQFSSIHFIIIQQTNI